MPLRGGHPADGRDADTSTGRYMPKLVQITIRLEPADAEALRRASFDRRMPAAVFGRLLIVEALSKQLPPAAPPSPADLAPAARQLLAALSATQSNLAQLIGHAKELGEPLCQLTAPDGALAAAGDQLRVIGIKLKTGSPAPFNADSLIAAADQINSLARRLNQDRNSVAIADWHGPLSSLKSALSET